MKISLGHRDDFSTKFVKFLQIPNFFIDFTPVGKFGTFLPSNVIRDFVLQKQTRFPPKL